MQASLPEFPEAESLAYAAVELGSDSFRLHVGRFEDGALRLVASLSEPVRLAASLDGDGMLCASALRRALACLAEFRAVLDAWRPHSTRVVATSALRMARNAALFLPAAGQALGRPIEIIAGDEAARLIYLGVNSTLDAAADAGPRLVIDIGSGATELVAGQGSAIRRIETFAVGAVRTSLTFFPDGRIDDAGFDAAVRSSRSRFAEAALGARAWELAYGACGTVRALAGIAAQEGEEGKRLTRAGLARIRRAFVASGHVARVRLMWESAAPVCGLPSHLPGGLAILIGLMEELDIAAVEPVHAGLRVGAMVDLHRQDVCQGGPALPAGALADPLGVA